MLHYLALLKPLAVPIAILIGTFIHGRLRTPSDLERAQHLSHLADEIVAAIKITNPNADWPDLVTQIVQALKSTDGVPTGNVDVLNRAAAAALSRAGYTAP